MIQSFSMEFLQKNKLYILSFFAILFLAIIIFFWISLNNLKTEYSTLTKDFNNLNNDLASSTIRISILNGALSSTTNELTDSNEENDDLNSDLRKEKKKNKTFEKQIDAISDTVGILDKLSKTDEELLQKYSKVLFLNENYIPEKISKIDKKYVYSESKTYKLHSKVMSFFEDMVEDALDDDINLWVVSSYRSFYEQEILKGNYNITYGSGANAFSAEQGFSEHQLGTTIDFTTNDINGGLNGFENTDAYKWLLKNAHKYGFILSYPEKNGYYIFEPWHWRFVGEKLARDLDKKNNSFYDWDQRKIDEYLISIFD